MWFVQCLHQNHLGYLLETEIPGFHPRPAESDPLVTGTGRCLPAVLPDVQGTVAPTCSLWVFSFWFPICLFMSLWDKWLFCKHLWYFFSSTFPSSAPHYSSFAPKLCPVPEGGKPCLVHTCACLTPLCAQWELWKCPVSEWFSPRIRCFLYLLNFGY